MTRRGRLGLAAVAGISISLLLPADLPAEENPPQATEGKAASAEFHPPQPEEKLSVTHHTATLGGRKLSYTATAGQYLLRTEEGKPRASVFFVAYTLDGVAEGMKRPVTFSFNGGPGAPALWVHLGAFGPKKVRLTDEGMPIAPPGELVDNEYSLLPATDLVFIDPVSTGFSRAVPGEAEKQFHGYKEDIESVGEFIRLWVSRNSRWGSPKFLAGESYGTTRAAGLANYLQSRFGMFLNGVVLISSVLNWQHHQFDAGNDMPYLIFLPSYAAAAWYHKRLPPELSGDLEKTLAEVEQFTLTDYALALLAGDALAPARRREVAERVARYTGLSVDYVERSNLRIEINRFTKELLRGQARTIGRLDARFLGYDRDSVGEVPDFDPALISVVQGFVTLFNDYVRRELGFESDLPYEYLAARVRPWSFAEFQNQYLNVGEDLRQAMVQNHSLKVLFAAGYYDFATPYFDAKFTSAHLGLPPEIARNVETVTFESGHMMYIRQADHQKLHQAVVDFLAKAVGR